jgi:SnoaL-like protein
VTRQAGRPTTLSAVRAHLKKIERWEWTQAAMDYSEDGVLDAGLRGVVAQEGTFRGRAAIGDWLERWFSSFQRGSYRFEIEQSVEHGDRLYLALCNIGRGEASGAETRLLLHHVFTVRDGLIERHAFSGEPEEIRREAGIAP